MHCTSCSIACVVCAERSRGVPGARVGAILTLRPKAQPRSLSSGAMHGASPLLCVSPLPTTYSVMIGNFTKCTRVVRWNLP